MPRSLYLESAPPRRSPRADSIGNSFAAEKKFERVVMGTSLIFSSQAASNSPSLAASLTIHASANDAIATANCCPMHDRGPAPKLM